MDKMMTYVPDEYEGRFVMDFGRKLIIKSKKCPAEMVLKWESGSKDKIYLEHLVVPKKNRNQGMGTELLQTAITLCKACKRHYICVWGVLSDKQKAWLEKKGFYDTEAEFLACEPTWTDLSFDDYQDFLSDEVLYELKV